MALPALRLLARGLEPRSVIVRVDAPGAHALEGQGSFVVAPDRGAARGRGPAVLFSDALRPAWGAFVGRAYPRIGRPTDLRRRLLSDPVAEPADPLPPLARGARGLLAAEHQADAFLRVAGAALLALRGQGFDLLPGDDVLEPGAEASRLAARAFASSGEPQVLLHPFAAGARTKRWPLDRWLRLGRRLRDDGLRLCVTAGPHPDDLALASALADAMQVPSLLGASRIPILVWAALARLVDIVVVPDTGLGHLARAAGASTLSIFTSTDPARHAPRGPGAALVVHGGLGLSCAPCYGDRCRTRPLLRCGERVEPGEVAALVREAVRAQEAALARGVL